MLEWIRDKYELGQLPVVILSSSSQESDISRGYSLGANSYLVKPVNHDDLVKMVEMIKEYWFDMNRWIGKEGEEE